MSGPRGHGAPGDPIQEYVAQLRAGLHCSPQEAEGILAEAEDHLFQMVAEGVAAGLTEREAQEAAISGFGSVQAVTRAHLARLSRSIGLVDLAMAAWKLIALLLLVGGAAAMASISLIPPGQRGSSVFQLAAILGPEGHARSTSVTTGPHHFAFNWISGNWTEVGTLWPIRRSSPSLLWVEHPVLSWHTVALLTAAGAVLLAGYGLTRRSQRHRGAPLAAFFPVVAVGFFGVVAVAVLGLSPRLRLSSVEPAYDPAFVMAALGVLLVGYAARIGRRLLRQRG